MGSIVREDQAAGRTKEVKPDHVEMKKRMDNWIFIAKNDLKE
jgi:hypothetical protein